MIMINDHKPNEGNVPPNPLKLDTYLLDSIHIHRQTPVSMTRTPAVWICRQLQSSRPEHFEIAIIDITILSEFCQMFVCCNFWVRFVFVSGAYIVVALRACRM